MNPSRSALSTIVLIATLAMTPTAFAHSAPEKARAFYGGITRETPRYNLELAIDDGRLRLFVRDRHNWPEYLPDGNAIAKLSGDQLALDLTLLPGDKGALTALGDFQKASVQRVAVTLWISGGDPILAEFELKPEDNRKLPIP